MERKINEEISRGDVYWCFPRNSSYGRRLYVVVSNYKACKYSNTILMCPLTTKQKKKLPTHVILEDVLGRTATVLTENIVQMNKKDIMDYVVTLSEYEMERLNVALFQSLGL